MFGSSFKENANSFWLHIYILYVFYIASIYFYLIFDDPENKEECFFQLIIEEIELEEPTISFEP